MKTFYIIIVVIGLFNIACGIYFLIRKKKKNQTEESTTPAEPANEPVNGHTETDEPSTVPSPEPEPVDVPAQEPAPAEPESPSEEEHQEEPEHEDPDDEGLWLAFCVCMSHFSDIYQTEVNEAWDKFLFDMFQSALQMRLKRNVIVKDNFPTPCEYWHVYVIPNEYAQTQFFAWYMACVLTELFPEKRDTIYKSAYQIPYTPQSCYGYTFEDDPNVNRLAASFYYAMTRNALKDKPEGLGSEGFGYEKDISDCFINLNDFMPQAPGPYLKNYKIRHREGLTELQLSDIEMEDKSIHSFVCKWYNLEDRNEVFDDTVQAIANKEYRLPHLFGKDSTVKDPNYGELIIHPVFGEHTIGIEIPDDGAIARLAEAVGMICSNNRKPLLDEEYGRRRPGQGETDGSCCAEFAQRVLVNHPIEDGDGHSTGFYNKGGDYVSKEGLHIGDFVLYYQNAVFANSYPSGHSAFIMGVAMVLVEVMPEIGDLIIRAANLFAISRVITRYHWMSDTIHGRVIGSMMIPVLHAIKSFGLDGLIEDARKEYVSLINKKNE